MNRRIRMWTVLATVVVAVVVGGGATNAFAVDTSSSHTAAVKTVVVPHVAKAAKARCCHISIPSNYVYNPTTTVHRSWHDYCTSSPDEFPAPGANANFRGPCARHDMCYQYKQKSQIGCDNQLLSHLTQECTYQYGSFDPRRGLCKKTAKVYWAVVIIHTIF